MGVFRVLPKPAKWLVKKGYYFLKIRRATPVIVYQIGKVGSSSIFRSLLKQYSGLVLHSHDFTQNHENPLIRWLYRRTVLNAKPLKVISLVREPIDRSVSDFFQNFERDAGVPYSEEALSIEELKDIYLSVFGNHSPEMWFENNIVKNFDIDVFSTPFPEKGVCTYTHNNIELLVMRSEISDIEKMSAINSFLGINNFQLKNVNIGSNKYYATTYTAFRNKVRFPPEYINKVCESKHFNHFYSKEVIDAARKKWSEVIS